jgi:cystathionine gamma-lyase
MPGPTFAGPFHLQGEVDSAEFKYTRYGNPTWDRYESALSELEGGEVVLFASGMAAATALLLTTLRPGSAVAMDHGCYRGVRIFAEEHLEANGVEVRLAAPADLEGVLAGAQMLWLESPSNPKLEVYDLAALAQAAHAAGALCVVDNTTAGPLFQKALELGADFVLTSATKHLSGHADVMLGYVATRDARWAQALRSWRTQTGAIAGPFEAWLAHRSLFTYALRLERGSANALAVAELPGRARRRDRRSLSGPAVRPGPRGGSPSDARLRDGPRLRRRQPRARRALPSGGGADHGGQQLRRRADDRRATRPLERGRRHRGLHPAVGRLR